MEIELRPPMAGTPFEDGPGNQTDQLGPGHAGLTGDSVENGFRTDRPGVGEVARHLDRLADLQGEGS
jgi:hypothetical protein